LGLPRNLAREGRRNNLYNLSYSKLGRWQYPTCRKSAWPDFDPAYSVLAGCRPLQASGAVRIAMFAMATGMMVLALFCLAPLMLTATSIAGVLDHDLL
jgi:hypothetical protein